MASNAENVSIDDVIMGGFVAFRAIDYTEGPHVISSHMLLMLSKAPKLYAMRVSCFFQNDLLPVHAIAMQATSSIYVDLF